MQAWEDFLKLLEKELGTNAVAQWLRPLNIIHFDAGNLYLEAKDSFQVSWFEEHIRKKANALLCNNNHRKIKVFLSIAGESPKKKASKKPKSDKPDILSIPQLSIAFDALNPLCTFDNFIGSSTQPLPHKLMHQITGYAKEQKTDLATFNPIYLWGPSGTGKTHLLMATAHELSKKGLFVAYVNAETFTEHVVRAIRASEMSLFRQSYRKADVLIVEDVHLLAKRGATQEELFHTFNTLHLAGKQIMLSANCSPSELAFIEPRLISRFEWGIVLPMDQLQYDEIRQVLQAKAKALNYPLNQKVSEFLLQTFISGTKALCRALEALVLRTHLNKNSNKFSPTQLTVAVVQQQLTDLIAEEVASALDPNIIILNVSEYFGIRPDDILGKAQSRDRTLPRQIAMYLCRSQLDMPFAKIGDLFQRDHSTVMSSVKLIQKNLDGNEKNITEPFHAILKKLRH